MIDGVDDQLNTIRAVVTGGYGALYGLMGIWLLWRGLGERPVVHRPSWNKPTIPGRIVLGIFLLFAAYREWDVSYHRFRGGTASVARAVGDWDSVGPIAVGLLFGIWAAVRFVRDDVGDQTHERKP